MILNGNDFYVVKKHLFSKSYQPITSTSKLLFPNTRFDVKVMNNATLSAYKLRLESNDITSMITVKVVDVSGRIIEVKQNVTAGQTVELGAKYVQGTYFAEVSQGSHRKVVKFIKAGVE